MEMRATRLRTMTSKYVLSIQYSVLSARYTVGVPADAVICY